MRPLGRCLGDASGRAATFQKRLDSLNRHLPNKAESTDRIEALSDGLFAVALTLLILDLRVPEVRDVPAGVLPAFLQLLPRIAIYIVSYLVVGYCWIWHHLTFAVIERSTRGLLWINLLALVAVSFLPFSTAFVARYPAATASVVIYGLNLLWFSIMLNVVWAYAVRKRLVAELDDATITASTRRSYIVTILCVIAIALSFVNPHLGLVMYVLIPIGYVLTGSRNALAEPS